jgi:hypothetical protein
MLALHNAISSIEVALILTARWWSQGVRLDVSGRFRRDGKMVPCQKISGGNEKPANIIGRLLYMSRRDKGTTSKAALASKEF